MPKANRATADLPEALVFELVRAREFVGDWSIRNYRHGRPVAVRIRARIDRALRALGRADLIRRQESSAAA